MKTIYEWCNETMDGDEIIDVNFETKLNDLVIDGDLSLVRREGGEDSGEMFRLYADVRDGKLAEFFSDSAGRQTKYKVPQKFHVELKSKLNK